MRSLQLLLAAFAVLVVGTFAGVSDVSAQNTGECVQSCKEECGVLPKDERKACKFACMGGRCGIEGVIVAAQATDEPGVDCSADGQCNTFCDVEPDPDCCSPSTTPLMAHTVWRAYPSLTLPPPENGFEISVLGLGPSANGGPWCALGQFLVWEGGAEYAPNRTPEFSCVVEQQVWIRPGPDVGPPVFAAGDFVVLVSLAGTGQSRPNPATTVFFPELTGDLGGVDLYPAEDGSTYYDQALTQLAASACDYPIQETCPCWVDRTLDEYFEGYTDNLSCSCGGDACGAETSVHANSAQLATESGWWSCAYYDDTGAYIRVETTPPEARACIDVVNQFIADNIGTPVGTNTSLPPGVCGEL